MQQAKDYASAYYQQYIVGWQQCTAHTVQSEKQTKVEPLWAAMSSCATLQLWQ